MSEPVIQYFPASGAWVKPAGAVRVDIVLQCPECGWTDPGKETPLQFLGVTLPPGEAASDER